MSSIPGFLVLGAVPLALVALLIIGIVAAWIAFRSQTTPKSKWRAAAVAVAIVVLIPTWDVILGRITFAYLCATDARTIIYKSVGLGPKRGKVQLPSNPAAYEKLDLSRSYPYDFDSTEVVRLGNVRLLRQYIRESTSKVVLGETRSYHYRGGWFLNTLSPSGTGGGDICRPDRDSFKTLLQQIFGAS